MSCEKRICFGVNRVKHFHDTDYAIFFFYCKNDVSDVACSFQLEEPPMDELIETVFAQKTDGTRYFSRVRKLGVRKKIYKLIVLK